MACINTKHEYLNIIEWEAIISLYLKPLLYLSIFSQFCNLCCQSSRDLSSSTCFEQHLSHHCESVRGKVVQCVIEIVNCATTAYGRCCNVDSVVNKDILDSPWLSMSTFQPFL